MRTANTSLSRILGEQPLCWRLACKVLETRITPLLDETGLDSLASLRAEVRAAAKGRKEDERWALNKLSVVCYKNDNVDSVRHVLD